VVFNFPVQLPGGAISTRWECQTGIAGKVDRAKAAGALQTKTAAISYMKTALVTPFLGQLPLYPSSYLGYGAALLKNRVELDIMDLNAEICLRNIDILKKVVADFDNSQVILDSYHLYPVNPEMLDEVEREYERISWNKYESVFITMPSWFVNIPTENVLKLSDLISKASPESKIFFFGNSLGSWTCENELKDFGIGIRHLNHLFEANPAGRPVHYDSLPTPIYEQRQKYIFDILPFRLKHGCTWGQCRFCSLAKGWNAGYKERSAAKVIQEIEKLEAKYSPTMFACNDNSINGDNLIEFCSYFEQFKKPWAAMARADLSEQAIAALQRAGCKLIYFGLESGSDRILNEINKGISSNQMSNFVRKLDDHNIMPAPSLIVGTPGETEDDFNNTVRFVKDHKDFLKILNVYPFMASPVSDYSLLNEQADDHVLLRLRELFKVCLDSGIKVCVGEQSAEYVLYNEVYPDQVRYWTDPPDQKNTARLTSEIPSH